MNTPGKKQAAWMVMLAIFGIESVRAGDNIWTRLGRPSAAVTALAVDPQNSGTVYAANGAGLFKSADEGMTWTGVNPGPPCCVLTLVIDPQNPTTLYAVTRDGAVKEPRWRHELDCGKLRPAG